MAETNSTGKANDKANESKSADPLLEKLRRGMLAGLAYENNNPEKVDADRFEKSLKKP